MASKLLLVLILYALHRGSNASTFSVTLSLSLTLSLILLQYYSTIIFFCKKSTLKKKTKSEWSIQLNVGPSVGAVFSFTSSAGCVKKIEKNKNKRYQCARCTVHIVDSNTVCDSTELKKERRKKEKVGNTGKKREIIIIF